MIAEVSIDFDPDWIEGDTGARYAVLSLWTDQVYCMFDIPPADFLRFTEVGSRRWIDGSIPIGRCAGSGAFWSSDENGVLKVVIGHDDQTWDISFTMPPGTLERIVSASEKLRTPAG